MKNITKTILALIILSSGLSCEPENAEFTPSNSGYIQLANDTSESVLENSTSPVVIELLLDGPKSQDVTINLDATSSDDTRYQITPSATVVIPAGETSASVNFEPVNNLDIDGEIDVTVSLNTTSSIPVGIAGQNVNAVSKVITITDDDCPLTINDWVGFYTVSEMFTDGDFAGIPLSGAFGQTYLLSIALDPSDVTGTKVIINNALGFNTYVPNGTVMQFLSCNGIVNFDSGNLFIAEFETQDLEAGSTSYNESDFSIKGNGSLGDFGPYEWIWTKI